MGWSRRTGTVKRNFERIIVIIIFPYPLIQTKKKHVLGAHAVLLSTQIICLIETILLSTHNICFIPMILLSTNNMFVCLFVFVALRPMSTAMVIAGRSVHLTTLFPGQA